MDNCKGSRIPAAVVEHVIPQIHHVCGIDELRYAPLEQAVRVVSIIDAQAEASPIASISRPLLILRFDDAITQSEDTVLPAAEHICALLAFDSSADPAEPLVIHCTAGISRSTAALALLLAQRHPKNEAAIFAYLRSIRTRAWPNELMVELGDSLLGLNGSLLVALHDHYELQAKRFPALDRLMQWKRPKVVPRTNSVRPEKLPN